MSDIKWTFESTKLSKLSCLATNLWFCRDYTCRNKIDKSKPTPYSFCLQFSHCLLTKFVHKCKKITSVSQVWLSMASIGSGSPPQDLTRMAVTSCITVPLMSSTPWGSGSCCPCRTEASSCLSTDSVPPWTPSPSAGAGSSGPPSLRMSLVSFT